MREKEFEVEMAADRDDDPEQDRPTPVEVPPPGRRGPAIPPGADGARQRVLPPSEHYAAHIR